MSEAAPHWGRATMDCRHCATVVPAGAFCGECGAHLTPRPGDGPEWLRAGAFVAAPHESVFRPSLSSTLLPQLSELTRRPFNLGLIMMIAAMAVLVELHVPGGLITVASLGLPLLLLVYWRRSGVFDEIPRWAVLTTVVLAIGLAIGWVWLSGNLIARVGVTPFEAGTVGRRILRDGLGVEEGSAVLMLIPAVIVRLLWRGTRCQSLDGFVIGVLSALMFTGAATLTRLAPQFTSAPVARTQPVDWLFFEAAVRGVTVPLTAACGGGLVGIALWFSRPRSTTRVTRRTVIAVLLLFAVAILGVYAAVGWADAEGASQLAVLAWHVVMAVIALIVLRIGLQLTLLNEQAPPPTGAELLCLSCRHVAPEMDFCPACGVATRASPPRSRRERRRVTPESTAAWADSSEGDTDLWPGYAAPADTYIAARVSRQSPIPVLTTWLAGMVILTAIFVGLPALTVKPPPRYNCPPDCGHPPSGRPVSTNPRYTVPGGQFSVAYPAPGSAYVVTTDDTGVTARFTAGDGGEMRLTGEPAAGRSAKEVVKAFLAAKFPTARKAYQVPNAKLGFQPAYGEVADVFPLDLDNSFKRMRVVVIASVKNDFALIAAGTGPYREFGPNFGPGRPSPANVQIAEDMGRYVNSFMWQGDPPR